MVLCAGGGGDSGVPVAGVAAECPGRDPELHLECNTAYHQRADLVSALHHRRADSVRGLYHDHMRRRTAQQQL